RGCALWAAVGREAELRLGDRLPRDFDALQVGRVVHRVRSGDDHARCDAGQLFLYPWALTAGHSLDAFDDREGIGRTCPSRPPASAWECFPPSPIWNLSRCGIVRFGPRTEVNGRNDMRQISATIGAPQSAAACSCRCLGY